MFYPDTDEGHRNLHCLSINRYNEHCEDELLPGPLEMINHYLDGCKKAAYANIMLKNFEQTQKH
jgi:hypothetical protein